MIREYKTTLNDVQNIVKMNPFEFFYGADLAKLKNDLLSNLSLTGLELIDGDIYYNDVIYDKLNTAQQIEFAVEIAKLRAGEVGIICVDGIERLDNETYTEFKKKAIESGLQLIVTKVTNGDLNLKIERCNNE